MQQANARSSAGPRNNFSSDEREIGLASRRRWMDVTYNVPAKQAFLAPLRAAGGAWDFTPIYGSLRTD
jgi:hypothetical protein